ncbi:MAG: hypothetical protein Kow0088_22550 [Anaerolineales bacterium]
MNEFPIIANPTDLFQSFFRFVPFGFLFIDSRKRIVLANHWIQERAGNLKRDLVGLNIEDILEEHSKDYILSRLDETIQIGATQTISFHFHPRVFQLYDFRGEILPQSVMFFPAYESNQISGAFVLIQDASERLLSESHLKRQIQKLKTLNEIERALRTLDYQTCLKVIVREVRKHFDVAFVALLILSRQELHLAATEGWEFPKQATILKVGEGITGWVAQNLQPAIVNNVKEDTRYYALFSSIQSEIAVPLIVANQCVGVLDLESEQSNAFTQEDLELLELIASSAAIAIHNARIHQEQQLLATTDGLTGLLNRRKFFEVANTEIERARRFNHPLSILMMDLDHFKDYNDTFGHLSGDELLVQVANELRSSLREFDTLARYGGDEFVLLLPEVNQNSAKDIAQRLISIVENMKVTVNSANNDPIYLTMSVGVATFPERGDNVHSLIKAADRALYQAKEAGRNRYIIYESKTIV